MTDIRMYILTDRTIYAPEDPMYRPLQVGSALSGDLGYEQDDTGDNISGQYSRFHELTGLYWIWKNVKCDVVGVSLSDHYFCHDQDILRKNRIDSLLKEGYDVILPETEASSHMLITTKGIFDTYCEWLFGKLFAAEEGVDPAVPGAQPERHFFRENSYRIATAPVQETDLQHYREAMEVIARKKEVLKKMLDPLIRSYAGGNPIDLIDLKSKSQDFHGKLPIWVCWWQGEDEMPDIVRACYQSLQHNFPEESTEIRLITFENLSSYVRFPDFIMEKYKKQVITLTHLSDLLRMALLTLYGGFWLDATYLLPQQPEEWMLKDGELFTQRFPELRYSDEMIVKGRWTGNLLRVKSWNPLTRFVLNAFYCYWAACDTLIDYFLIDYLILLAYEEIPSVHEMVDSCPPSQPELYSMEILLNEAYDEEKWSYLTKDTTFFKLSYKHVFKNNTEDGKLTYYAKIIQQYGSDVI